MLSRTTPERYIRSIAAGKTRSSVSELHSLDPCQVEQTPRVLQFTLGILMIVLGTLGFFQPIAYTVATAIFFGALLLVTGGAGIVAAFKLEGWKGKTGAIVLAILFLITGALMLLHPVLAALSLTLVVAAFLTASGLVKIWMGFSHREQSGWGWLVASGLLSVVLGILIYAGFPDRACGSWACSSRSS